MAAIVSEVAKSERGTIQIAPEVLEVIAGLAAGEVPGVAGAGAGGAAGIVELIGKKPSSRGVKVTVGDRELEVDVSVAVEYGHRIPRLAEAVQQNVKRAIESMTGLQVAHVHVHILGVHVPAQQQAEAAPLMRVM